MKTPSLFAELPQADSPRLAWMKRHGVLTHYFADDPPESRNMAIIPFEEDAKAGRDIADCMAHHARLYVEANLIGYGKTKNEALRDLAVKHNLKTWNEE